MNEVNRKDDKPRICFVHIPKTAGTSITSCLQNFYSPKEVAPTRTMLDYKKMTKEDLKKYRLYKGHIYYSFAKENLPSDTLYITVLRDPVERVMSLYKFWRSHTDDFFQNPNIPDIIKHGPKMAKSLDFLSFVKSEDPFVVQSTQNNQIRQLSKVNRDFIGKSQDSIDSEDFIKDLSKFKVIGVLDLINFFTYEVNRLMNSKVFDVVPKKNVSSESRNYFEDITEDQFQSAIEIVTGKNRLEIQVYEFVEAQAKSRINDFFSRQT